MTKIWSLYCEQNDVPASIKIYREVFNKTGLKFKSPQLDTCQKCDTYAIKLKHESDENKLVQIKQQQVNHYAATELAYRSKSNDKKLAKHSDKSIILASFDLQKCLPTPHLQSSVAFYKRPLWTFNLTINTNHASSTKCYMWHEAEGNRGANEIASCLNIFLKSLDPMITRVIFYSDNCSRQNKNKIFAGMFSASVNNHPTLQIVDHKFLETGHTHMECDSDHALIEKKTGKEIHVLKTGTTSSEK